MRLAVAVLLAACVPAAAKPNVVVVMTDDMGFSDIGCYGGEIRTPNLDALAANGVRFTQFYNCARCCPTRASLLTGLYPHQAGVGHMTTNDKLPGYEGELNRNCRTIAEVLRPAGYRTYMAGKWHVCRNVAPDGPKHDWPTARGFDRFYGMISGAGSYYDPFTLCRGDALISAYADPEYKPERYYFTDAITDHAVRFVGDHAKGHAGTPFFLYVAYTAAHWPMHALPEDIARYEGTYAAGYDAVRRARLERAKKLGVVGPTAELPPAAEDWEKVADKKREAALMAVYAAMVDRMDQGVGKLVAELKRTGQLDDTLILFLQDNGGCAERVAGFAQAKGRVNGPRAAAPSLPPVAKDARATALYPPQTRDGYPVRMGDKVEPGPADTFVSYDRGWANVSNTPLREYKHWVHEGGISTPLVAHWPKGIAARGELRTQPGHLIDVMATALDVSGASYPTDATPPEGKSLVPAFAGRPIDRDAIFWEHEGNRAVRAGDWKLVAKGPGGQWELYDMAADRAESRDRAGEHPAKVSELAGKWEAWAARAHALPWPWKVGYTRAGSAVGPADANGTPTRKP